MHALMRVWQFGKGGSKNPKLFRPKKNAILKSNARRNGFVPHLNIGFKIVTR